MGKYLLTVSPIAIGRDRNCPQLLCSALTPKSLLLINKDGAGMTVGLSGPWAAAPLLLTHTTNVCYEKQPHMGPPCCQVGAYKLWSKENQTDCPH